MTKRKKKNTDTIANVGILVAVLVIVGILIFNWDFFSNDLFGRKLDVHVGDTVEMKNQYSGNADSSQLEFYSSDESIATIDKETGVLYAKKDGKTVITIKSKSGSNRYTIHVKKLEVSSGTIEYDQDHYSCYEGQVIDTTIKTSGGVSSVGEFRSSNTSVATVEIGTSSGSVTNCVNCMAVHITCKRSGKANLSANSTTGAATTSVVEVISSNNNWIKFDKNSYSCGEGEVIDTMIRTGGDIPSAISSFKSSDASIATIEEGTSSGDSTNCINCKAVHITCKKSGKVTLSATSSSGETTSSSVAVTSSSKGWIKFDKTGYSCVEGEVIDTMITAGGVNGITIQTIKSSNSSVATIENGTSSGLATNCVNCRAVHITCRKTGTITVSATASTGIETSSTIKVSKKATTPSPSPSPTVTTSPSIGWIKYDKTSYSCKAGEVIDTMIRTGGDVPSAINSFKSSDTSIATIENGTSSGDYTNCINCRAVHITCKKSGTVTLTATSSTGATTSSSVKVTEADKGWIQYESSSYSCKAGEVIDTMIRTGGGDIPSTISGYRSSDTNIATIEDGFSSGLVTNCINCRAVHITCKKSGTVTLTATSSTGATTSSTVQVAEPDKGWIKYDKTSYSCKVGEVIDTMIKSGGGSMPSAIDAYKSSDTSVATIENGFSTGIATNCINCRAVHITCKKVGKATLSASSSLGASTTVSVTVSKK